MAVYWREISQSASTITTTTGYIFRGASPRISSDTVSGQTNLFSIFAASSDNLKAGLRN